MKKTYILYFVILMAVVGACTVNQPATPTSLPTPTYTPTATQADVVIEATLVPEPLPVAQAFLDAWKMEAYPEMYALLTKVSQDATPIDAFTKRYQDVAIEAALKNLDVEILAAFVKNPSQAEVGYRVTLHSALVGDIQRDTAMNLKMENGQWRIQWDSRLILPELEGQNQLNMTYSSPSRANIYDQNGHAMVAYTDAWAFGLDAANVGYGVEASLLSTIYEATQIRPEKLADQIETYRVNRWYLPVADFSNEQILPFYTRLAAYDGVKLTPFKSRYYFQKGLASHATGYVRLIQEAEVNQYKRLGYNPWADRVGETGIEKWGEDYLAGKRGGTLTVLSPDKAILSVLAQTDTEPAQAIYTTIDTVLQEQARLLLKGFGGKGAIVVLERDTGRVLAMASYPDFNPNLFEPTNLNSASMLKTVYDPTLTPLLNRATQGQYPLGSVFKVITMAAALQSGVFTSETTYECGYHFTELPGVTLDDWTYEHFLKDGVTQPSGTLTLPEGLAKSCNPWFYHIGLELYNRGMTRTVSDMARGFGLGSVTGIEIEEEPGNIPDPVEQTDATNLAIGQGNTLVTPLQVASFMAAMGNGGKLYQPKLVEKIVNVSTNAVTFEFTSTLRSTLPISATNLKTIQDAMVNVLTPKGTARTAGAALRSYNIPAAGKTGTAQSGGLNPHAWFAGYTFANNPDKPDIAVAVILENAGEGSEWAAPIFAAIVRLYFYPDRPREAMRWELAVGIPKSSPTPTATPVPPVVEESTPTPTP